MEQQQQVLRYYVKTGAKVTKIGVEDIETVNVTGEVGTYTIGTVLFELSLVTLIKEFNIKLKKIKIKILYKSTKNSKIELI